MKCKFLKFTFNFNQLLLKAKLFYNLFIGSGRPFVCILLVPLIQAYQNCPTDFKLCLYLRGLEVDDLLFLLEDELYAVSVLSLLSLEPPDDLSFFLFLKPSSTGTTDHCLLTEKKKIIFCFCFETISNKDNLSICKAVCTK